MHRRHPSSGISLPSRLLSLYSLYVSILGDLTPGVNHVEGGRWLLSFFLSILFCDPVIGNSLWSLLPFHSFRSSFPPFCLRFSLFLFGLRRETNIMFDLSFSSEVMSFSLSLRTNSLFSSLPLSLWRTKLFHSCLIMSSFLPSLLCKTKVHTILSYIYYIHSYIHT